MVRNRGGLAVWRAGRVVMGFGVWKFFAKKESVSTPLVFFVSSGFLASLRLWRRTFLEGN